MQKHCWLELRNVNFKVFSILTMKMPYFIVSFFSIRTYSEFLALKFFPLINKINISWYTGQLDSQENTFYFRR